jgi:hypothetical protein
MAKHTIPNTLLQHVWSKGFSALLFAHPRLEQSRKRPSPSSGLSGSFACGAYSLRYSSTYIRWIVVPQSMFEASRKAGVYPLPFDTTADTTQSATR